MAQPLGAERLGDAPCWLIASWDGKGCPGIPGCLRVLPSTHLRPVLSGGRMAPGWTVLAPALALLAVGPPRPAGSSGEGRWTCARGRARAWISSVTTARSTLRARRQGGWASSVIESWLGCMGGPGCSRSRAGRWPLAALPPEEQASGWCSCFAVRVAGAGLLGAPRKPL